MKPVLMIFISWTGNYLRWRALNWPDKIKMDAADLVQSVVIMITTAELGEIEIEAKAAGVDDFLSKPPSPFVLSGIHQSRHTQQF